MAQKKTVKTEEVVETQEVSVEKVVEEKKVNENAGISEKTAVIEELPDYAKKALKLYENEPELYVSPQGGVFAKNTSPALVGSAILFKNPYYKF